MKQIKSYLEMNNKGTIKIFSEEGKFLYTDNGVKKLFLQRWILKKIDGHRAVTQKTN